MARQSSFMNNAATDFEGWSRWLTKLFRPGVATGWTVSQRGLGANMTVDVAAGDGVPMTTNTAPYSWSTTAENVTIAAASANNRRDLIVAYVDLSVTNPSTSTPNNPSALKFLAVTGTPAGSPSDPNDTAIRATAVGATNPYLILARVTLTSSTTQITNAQITNLQTSIALNVQRLWGGSSNTLGHLVPNQADGTLVTTTDTNSVSGQMLSTSAVTLGYASSSVSQSGITSEVDATSLSVTVAVPTGGRRIKISWNAQIGNNTSGGISFIRIKEGSTTIGLAQIAAPNGVNTFKFNDWVSFVPTAGSHTYKITAQAVSGTIAIDGATNPACILVEAI